MSTIHLIGISHKTLSIAERENFNFHSEKVANLTQTLRDNYQVEDAVIVSTCNRFEIYCYGNITKEECIAFLCSLVPQPLNPSQYFYETSEEATRHLFMVAASLDSMVIGENQILLQLKDAYALAHAHQSTGKIFNRLFQYSFRIAKKIRENTTISGRGISLSYIAVLLARKIFGDLSNSTALVIGSGTMAELVAIHLHAQHCKKIIVANRTLERASVLSHSVGGSAITLGEIKNILPDVDIAISSITIDKPIIEYAFIKKLVKRTPLFLIDLGVPRNFSPSLAEIDNVYLYNLDDLQNIAHENKLIREEAAKDATVIVEFGVYQFQKWLNKIAKEPELLSVREIVRSACEDGVKDFLGFFRTIKDPQNLTENKVQEITDELSFKLSQKISHNLLKYIQSKNPEDVEFFEAIFKE
jgi:glutamyl-tRNA reductase